MLSGIFHGGIEETQKKLTHGDVHMRFEPNTYSIQVWRVTPWPTYSVSTVISNKAKI
jgi:hypothetical protein